MINIENINNRDHLVGQLTMSSGAPLQIGAYQESFALEYSRASSGFPGTLDKCQHSTLQSPKQ